MKVLVLGATGIIGSHLRITPHPGITATYHKGRKACDLTDPKALGDLLSSVNPDVIVNLAGESRPDVVEANPTAYECINSIVPSYLSDWTERNNGHLIQVSTQAVFGAEDSIHQSPYSVNSIKEPVNAYGRQKEEGEVNAGLGHQGGMWKWDARRMSITIIRPTFVLGIRPDPAIGRPNPVELMLEGQKKQVNDRWFSPSFAPDVAELIWDVCQRKPSGQAIHAGVPVRVSRYDIARALGCDVEPVSHEDFPGIAPRPMDTTFAEGAEHRMNFTEGIADCLQRWKMRQKAVAA